MWFFSSRMRKVQKAIEKLGMYLEYRPLEDNGCGNCFLSYDDVYELRKKDFRKRALGDIVETSYSCYFTYCYMCNAITDHNINAARPKYKKPVRFDEWLAEQEPNLADEKILTEAFDQLTKERKKVMDKLNKVHEVNDKLLGPYRSNGKLLKE